MSGFSGTWTGDGPIEGDEMEQSLLDMDIEAEMEAMAGEYAAAEQEPAPQARTRKSGPGSRFVEVPAEAIHKCLRDAGFTEGRFGNEVVYSRVHGKCKHLSIIVCTSLRIGADDARGCGEDAIRILAKYKSKKADGSVIEYCLKEASARVFRTGSVEKVLQRMLERAREAYAACNERCKSDKRCWACCGRP